MGRQDAGDRQHLWEQHYRRGYELLQSGDWEGAIHEFSCVIEIDATNHEAFHFRGVGKHRLSKLDDAISDLSRAIALFDDEPQFHADLGEALIDADRLDEARKALQMALQKCLPHEEVLDQIERSMRRIIRYQN